MEGGIVGPVPSAGEIYRRGERRGSRDVVRPPATVVGWGNRPSSSPERSVAAGGRALRVRSPADL